MTIDVLPPNHSDIPNLSPDAPAQLRTLTHILYALYAICWLTGGLTGLIALIISYIKRADLRKMAQRAAHHSHSIINAPLYIAHFTWQIRTFWGLVAFTVLGVLLSLVLIGPFVLLAGAIWAVYRIIKGWLYLSESRLP